MPDETPATSQAPEKSDFSMFNFITNSLGRGEFNYCYSVSLPNNYVYIENAKSACTTLKGSLGSAELKKAGLAKPFADIFAKDVHRNVLGTPFIKPYQLGQWRFDRLVENPKTVIFTFVKNPFSRILSAYLDKVQRKLPDSAALYAAANKTFDDPFTFLDYLKTINQILQSGKRIDKHFRPQFLQCGQGKLRLDFVGRVENFDQDFQTISTKIGLVQAEVILGVSHSTKAKSLLSDYYNPEARALLLEIYGSDFDAFGYDKKV